MTQHEPTRRDPQALARLTGVLSSTAQRLAAAGVARRRGEALVASVRSVPRLAPWLALVAVAAGFTVLVPWWVPPLAAVLLAGLVFVVVRSQQVAAAVSLADGALACDRANDNQDRLAAACELAGAAPRGAELGEALARAAIEDGVQSLQRIDPERLQMPSAPASPAWGLGLLCVAGLALLPLLLPPPAPAMPYEGQLAQAPKQGARADGATRRDESAADRGANELAPQKRSEEKTERKEPSAKAGTPPPPPKPAAPAPAVPAASGQGTSGSDAAGDSSQNGAPKAAPAGKPGSGQSGGGQGSAASGAPEPQPSEQPPKAPPKPKKPQAQKDQPQQDGKPSESAGAPSGPSRGSGRLSAVGNKRNDLNRGQEREDDPEVEDEPVEDETDEQEQRGGVMPMRRGDNRPAARELSISGDGPPDAGRGGPTPPKKSRGTASLVLGLRLPDSVRGQPNPGTAKTSLEQIPPRPSAADPGLARAVAAGRPTTPQSLRPPTPFLALQQTYHALLRARDSAATTPATNSVSLPTPADSPKEPR